MNLKKTSTSILQSSHILILLDNNEKTAKTVVSILWTLVALMHQNWAISVYGFTFVHE